NFESAIQFYTPSQSLVSSGGIFYNSNLLPYGFIFRTNSFPRMYLNNNGDLGIGTSPSAKLHVGSGTVRIDGPSVPGGNALSLGGYGDLQVDAFGTPGGRLVVKENGNVGIGNPTPGFLLSFPNSLGDKISLWGNSGSHYGFGIQSNLLQIHTDGVTSDIAFGYGASSAFIERFRMKNNGAFVVNGNAGTAGQVLKSNGSTSPPSWTSSTNSLYNNMVQVFATDSVGITVSNTWIPIPGMTYSFVTTGNAKVIAMLNVQVFPGFCFSCNATTASIGVFVDGSLGRSWTEDVFNSASQNISGSYLIQVGSGGHTIDIRGKKIGSSAYFGFAIAGIDIGNNMVLQIIPE
ncbi:MAG TPA: hypothetical protein VKH37_12115, partial [Ferruginibacter sp.]|nr:hypothetical protein [Ferruginibacter sp.]